MDQHLVAELEPLINVLPGRAALLVKQVGADVLFTHNADEPFSSASLIKLPLLWEYGCQIASGQLDPRRACIVPLEAIVGGRGIIHLLAEQPRLRCQDMAALMIVVSDNSAANLLIDALGGLRELDASMKRRGFEQSRLRRYLGDESARQRGQDNVMTAADVALVLERIALGEGLPPNVTDHLLSLLMGQQLCAKLPANLPLNTTIAHKTGELPGIEHDAGILYHGPAATIVVVMTSDLDSNVAGRELCRQVGRIVYDWVDIHREQRQHRHSTATT
ncbi:MAG: serine hydrolase [Candidatus Promineifilaceae bacterium]|nr:serine hydrolase [Candidatus Promineifilaceae bacterium]